MLRDLTTFFQNLSVRDVVLLLLYLSAVAAIIVGVSLLSFHPKSGRGEND